MDNQAPVSRFKLESLSTNELIKLADTHGIDIPPGLERIFIIEELLDIMNTDNKEEPEESIEINPTFPETAVLPKQYNISFIEVIIRDPLWVFVFWEIKGHDRETAENADDFNGYFLRIIPLDENGAEPKSKENSFTVSISPDDCARYIGLAENTSADIDSHQPGCYVIKLGVLRGDTEHHITSSPPFFMPRLSENETISELNKNPLMHLSGIQDLSITKNTDRQSRLKRQ